MIDAQRRRWLTTLGAAGALGLGACARPTASIDPALLADVPADMPTIDLHSHAGHLIPSRTIGFARPLTELAAPMRAGGMDVVCLAVVADTPCTRDEGGSIRAWRQPLPGELYAYAQGAFARAHALVAREDLVIVRTADDLKGASGRRRSVIIASEGGDFLEGKVDRVDEFRERHGLRHLQLTHYRVNELGDIQTAPPVHGRLTDVGRAVVGRCNRLGIVVDVAHAPLAMVRGVVDVTDRPIVLSHTSLTKAPVPPPTTRLVTAEHARLVASTGGVIGIWPPASRFPTMAALATGIAAMVDVVGVDHVGLGTDMLGLTGPAVFESYAQLPALRQALRDTGFAPEETARLLGGNYARVFVACVA